MNHSMVNRIRGQTHETENSKAVKENKKIRSKKLCTLSKKTTTQL